MDVPDLGPPRSWSPILSRRAPSANGLDDGPSGAAARVGPARRRLEPGRDSPSELPIAQVKAFARSLVRKRAAEVRSLLPRTAEALGSEFARQFERHAACHPVAGAKRQAADAVAFARRLGARAPDRIADLARYEAAWVEMGIGRRLLLRSFRHAVDQTEAASTATIWMIWIRPPWGRGTRVWRCWPPRLTPENRRAE